MDCEKCMEEIADGEPFRARQSVEKVRNKPVTRAAVVHERCAQGADEYFFSRTYVMDEKLRRTLYEY